MSQRYIGGLIYNPPGGFSGYFDGSGDFLTAPDNAAFNLSGDFTIEAWVNVANISSEYCVFHNHTSNTNGVALTINSGAPRMLAGNGSWYILTNSSTTIAANTWNHIAYTRSGSTWTIWVNGVSGGTATSSTTPTYSGGVQIGQLTSGVPLFFPGYISNLRVLKGTALYTSAFTPPVGPLQAITNTSLLTCAYPTFRDGSSNNFTITVNGNTAVSVQNPFPQTQLPNPALGNQGNGVYSMSQYQALRSQNLWPAIDPYFDFVTLMLHGNGTNGAQNNTFLDSSTNNFTITRNGNTTQGTFTPYGSNWSNYFVDSSSSYLNIASSSIVNFGTSDFTAEAWVNLNALDTSIDTIISNYNNGSNGGLGWYINRGTNGGIQVYSGNSLVVSASSAVTAGTWNHIAICRASGTTRIFVNGAIAASASDSSNYGADNSATGIGGTPPGSGAGAYLPGYLSNVRVVKGTALYTSAFTPSTSPLTAISGTSLLTCQSNRFIDNSSNNFTITRNGDVSVQRFSPFNPTTPYAAGTIGGSGYFDGSGDYLSVASSSTLAFGTGDFTIEGWYYPLAYSGDVNTITSTTTADSASVSAVNINVHTDGSMQIGNLYSTGAGTVPLRAWTYFVVSRVSGTIRLFINGVEKSSASNTTNYTSTGCLIGARFAGSQYYITAASYISGLKFIVGSGVTSVTVPSAPPTGGNVLTNFTNGGIIDNAMMNDLETVGNAQISTSVSKFGGGSLAFDGNGDYLKLSNNTAAQALGFGTGDFTIECWVYPTTSAAANNGIYDCRYSASATGPLLYNIPTSGLYVFYNGSNVITGSNPTINTWSHIALVRSSGVSKLYLNGVQTGSNYTDTNNYTSGSNSGAVGAFYDGSGSFNGYIDDLRITRGYARYTANFTPQRSQWQDQ